MRLSLLAPAKINLFLEVLGRRADGYHELDSIVQTVSLLDRVAVEVRRGRTAVRVACDDPAIPGGEGNTAHRAAALFLRAAGIRRRVEIRLEKSIPAGAGLGGGSSNAAAVLIGLNRLLGRPLSAAGIFDLAAEVGSDAPLFLRGGLLRMRGRGEAVRRLSPLLRPPAFLLIFPGFPSSTGEVYGALRPGDLTGPRRSASLALTELRRGEFESARHRFFNRLEKAAFRVHPPLRTLRSRFEKILGRPASLSGSGSSFYTLWNHRLPVPAQPLGDALPKSSRGARWWLVSACPGARPARA